MPKDCSRCFQKSKRAAAHKPFYGCKPHPLFGMTAAWRLENLARPAIIVLVAALAVLFDLAFGTVAYTHFFYLVLILAAFWYRRRAVAVGLLLAAVHVTTEYLFHGPPGPSILVSAATFIIAAWLLGYLFEVVGRRKGELHFRIDEPKPAACERDTGRLIALLSNRDPRTRYRAAGCLGDSGDPAAVEPLAALLTDPDPGVRWKAAEALGKLGLPAVGALTERLRHEDADVRWMAAVALGEIGDPAAVPGLLAALDDPDTYVRSRAAVALAEVGEAALEDLIAAIHNGDERVRWGAAIALGKIGGDRAVEALIKTLPDPDDDVRLRAAAALADIGEPAVPRLMDALGTDDDRLREGATAALSQIGRPAVPAVVRALREAGDWRIRAGAARVLGRIDDRQAVEALISGLDDAREEVHSAAREALLAASGRHNSREEAPERYD